MGTPQCRPGGHSPIKPRRPVQPRPTGGKTLNKPHNTAGTVMQNQPARRSRSMTLSRYVRLESRLSSQLAWVEYDPQEFAAPIRSSWCHPPKSKSPALKSMQRTLKMQSRCDHEQTIPTSVAGMERLVCESCGHVSIKLVNVGITRPGIPTPRHQIDGDSPRQSGGY